MNRRLTGYEFEAADKLKSTKKPYATKLAQFVLNSSIGDIQLQRVYIDFVIELEALQEKTQKELVEYKRAFGELK